VRAVAVHRDVVVVTSRLWQTTATALRAGGESLLVDSPYFPDELELLPTLLSQAGFEPNGLLATHADYDHLLGRLAFPGLALGVGESTARRLRAEPGKLEIGTEEIELHPAEGHTADGTALFARFAGVLVCGDYLSDVEIPLISGSGSLDDYRLTLARLAPLVDEAETVVPGHGAVHDRDAALRILHEDLDYLDALGRGEERPPLPAGRDSRRQRGIHAENLRRLSGAR
jgi:glyoxylase-like metal-dependent hydrolase (beta-lactamase superfamily II)